MVRFNTSRRPVRNYFSRREQWRLLLLVMSLGVVVLVMRELGRPETAERVEQVFTEAGAAEGPANLKADSNAAPEASPSKAGSVVAPRVRTELLAGVKDNTYFRNAEKDAWFELISVLQRTAAADLERGSGGEVGYVQLVDQPSAYRGKLVTVRGTARQVTRQTPAENDLGLTSYYHVVIQPVGGETWPIFVYALELPEGLSVGDELAVDVSATGFFFKNHSYPWSDGLGIAPVILVKQLTLASAENATGPPPLAARNPATADSWKEESDAPNAGAAANVPPLREVLSLAGWDAERFAKFSEVQPLSEEERKQLLELLWRVRTFDAGSIEAWAAKSTVGQLLKEPASHRGSMVRLSGRVTRAERHALSPEEAVRFEMPAYWTCEIATEDGPTAVVAANVPNAWQNLATLDEPVSVAGVFVKRTAHTEDTKAPLLVAKRIAWHPAAANEHVVSVSESLLGALGMDLGLLDDVRSRGAIRGEEREAFYQLLSAAGKIGANQLARFAQGNVDTMRQKWEAEAEKATDASRRALAQEVVRRSGEGRYSVAPLFNDATNQIGELVVVDGTARRVVRVDVGSRPDGRGASDVARRFGMGHYFEMEVFTDDSQNYPLIFCVRELPAGFPSGSELHVPVRVAGFFFKDWLYTTRQAASSEAADGKAAAGRAQYAPLLIGRAPLVLEMAAGEGSVARWVGAGLFTAALVGIWGAAWWFARGDRKFSARTRAAFSVPPGQSLNELKLSAVDEPMK